jgi:autotransporter family porin
VNAQSNRTVGHHVKTGFFPPGDSPQAAKLTPLISGEFTGTTREILQWAACKWGIDQDVVFAQAAVESWWQQAQLGDWAANAMRCPPGHGIGADGKPGECPQSYGILQNKYHLEETAWPGIGVSTAMNADAAYAIWRSCYDGYEIWLNDGPKGRPYHAGDLWGCVGRWFAGSWYTPVANRYIDLVKKDLSERVWLQPHFVQNS